MTQFKVGDKVHIVRKIKSHTHDWHDSWIQRMDSYVGSFDIYTISNIHGIERRSCLLRDELSNLLPYNWPIAALELCASVLSKEERINNKIKTLWNSSKYVKKNPHLAY